ncbi:MAG TPA: SURF1 family protein [Gemmatimonadaceae bacterium]|jgi:surfeit locus 1 family protein|nr:SURF1 family protein [Gemmatimonadaceae bacterium]
MTRRTIGFVIFAAIVSAVCVRLGFWQLDRREERRALNAMLATRLGADPEPVFDVIRDSATAQFRRATARGTYDFANEVAVGTRTHQGSPGVHVLTPLRVAGRDTALLVNRGWVYSPDAMRVDLGRWVEADTATVTGYLLVLPRGGAGQVSVPANRRTVRRLDLDSLGARLPYPIAPFLLVQTAPPRAVADSATVRVAAPVLDEGPHLGYAFQWFAFALIGLIGAAVIVRIDRRGSQHARGGRGMVRQPLPRDDT